MARLMIVCRSKHLNSHDKPMTNPYLPSVP